eukprot:g4324.t1
MTDHPSGRVVVPQVLFEGFETKSLLAGRERNSGTLRPTVDERFRQGSKNNSAQEARRYMKTINEQKEEIDFFKDMLGKEREEKYMLRKQLERVQNLLKKSMQAAEKLDQKNAELRSTNRELSDHLSSRIDDRKTLTSPSQEFSFERSPQSRIIEGDLHLGQSLSEHASLNKSRGGIESAHKRTKLYNAIAESLASEMNKTQTVEDVERHQTHFSPYREMDGHLGTRNGMNLSRSAPSNELEMTQQVLIDMENQRKSEEHSHAAQIRRLENELAYERKRFLNFFEKSSQLMKMSSSGKRRLDSHGQSAVKDTISSFLLSKGNKELPFLRAMKDARGRTDIDIASIVSAQKVAKDMIGKILPFHGFEDCEGEEEDEKKFIESSSSGLLSSVIRSIIGDEAREQKNHTLKD